MMVRATYSLIVVIAYTSASIAQTTTQFTSLAARSATPNSRSFSANEHHIQSEMLGPLYANSAFAHGYRHGYEQGFHLGDLDVQLGRAGRIALKSREYSPGREYRPSFGSKSLFEEGYHAGLHNGYADALSGAEFRATERAKAAGAGLSDVLSNTRRAHFDEGIAAGYRSAQSQNAPVAQMNAEYVEQYCRRTLTTVQSLEYCSGFGRGYMLGISGTTPDSSRITTAQK